MFADAWKAEEDFLKKVITISDLTEGRQYKICSIWRILEYQQELHRKNQIWMIREYQQELHRIGFNMTQETLWTMRD
ncbi:uncharacterized protein DMENIID0001_091450 [Sergentomyia squamirostris]